MSKAKKRPSKAAKAAQKLLAESKLHTAANSRDTDAREFNSPEIAVRVNTTAMKPRPNKKRG